MKPLSVGNVVTAGLRIYRDNFKTYFKSAFLGSLWILVPVYGWAKYSAMMGMIARLAYGEVTEQPESVNDAQRHVKPKMWDFLVAGILVGLIICGAIIPFSIIIGIMGVVAGLVFGLDSGIGKAVGVLLIIAAVLLFVFGLLWLICRLFLVELPLAVEENATATSTIKRSWNLTKGSAIRIKLVVFIGFLISLPIILVSNIGSAIFQLMIGTAMENAPGLATIGGLLYLLLVLAGGALIIPFWQAIKAVVYYDLRVRREGMGIDLKK
ncbi:MAG: glycerophosphoryl diester phosphodiesterase membrane domain-containing protein [Waterburya sp.]